MSSNFVFISIIPYLGYVVSKTYLKNKRSDLLGRRRKRRVQYTERRPFKSNEPSPVDVKLEKTFSGVSQRCILEQDKRNTEKEGRNYETYRRVINV